MNNVAAPDLPPAHVRPATPSADHLRSPPAEANEDDQRLLRRNPHFLADVTHANAISYIPQQITRLADQIARQQNCMVRLAKERSGYHLYMPCPACLHTHGKEELRDPKYSINLSKYFGIGDEFRHLQDRTGDAFNPINDAYNDAASDERNHKTGICMRTWQSPAPHRFPVEELIKMDTITARHPDIHTSYKLLSGADGSEREAHWLEDPISGKLCPPPAGEIIPLSELSPFHPARWYMETYRRFDIKRLEELYRCGFCVKEHPESKFHKIWYPRFPGGWKDTPQGRIIFHSLHDGVPLSWQGR